MILIIDCGSSKTKHLEQIVDDYDDLTIKALFDFEKKDLEGIDGVIISGAPILVTEDDPTPYLEKFDWIKTYTKPLFGICFGHQMIGMTFGAFASRIREDRDWQTIGRFEDSPLFNRLPDEILMMEDHCEAISIPANFKLLASSDACVNEAMEHNELPIYGTQFHPEVSGNHGNIVSENFILIGQEERCHERTVDS